jgi:acylphosphatase
MDNKTLHFRVIGRVQGVGFRAYVKSLALEMGVSGWVKNLPDGSVLIFSVMPEKLADRWMLLVRKGPPSSQVDRIEVMEPSPKESLYSGEFIIVRSLD